MPDKQNVQDKLKALLDSYRSQLPQRLDEIEILWQSVCDQGKMERDGKELYRLVHSIAGSGASFGFSDLSKTAKEFEMGLKVYCESGKAFDKLAQDQLEGARSLFYASIKKIESEE